MDKYIDNFCEEYFSEFEELGLSNKTDILFDNPRMRPYWFSKIAVVVSLILVVVSRYISLEMKYRADLLKDIGVGLLSSSFVALWFEKRDKSIRYYEKVIGIINSRMNTISVARTVANEHIMNVSTWEGLQLLQFTVQNAYQFSGYIEDKLRNIAPLKIVEGIEVERNLDARITDDEMWMQIQKARQTIAKLLKRLDNAKLVIRMSALGKHPRPRQNPQGGRNRPLQDPKRRNNLAKQANEGKR